MKNITANREQLLVIELKKHAPSQQYGTSVKRYHNCLYSPEKALSKSGFFS